jgi:hypothetical protein
MSSIRQRVGYRGPGQDSDDVQEAYIKGKEEAMLAMETRMLKIEKDNAERAEAQAKAIKMSGGGAINTEKTAGVGEVKGVDYLLVAFQAYFILSNLTIERCYCANSVEKCASDGFLLGVETLDFATQYNPLFLARPEWLRLCTCFSAYLFPLCYLTIACTALFGKWRAMKTPLLLFMGAKSYAMLLYHYTEFTSATPPPSLLHYWGPEGPYLFSIALVLWRLSNA